MEWISVKERLPEMGRAVLFIVDDWYYTIDNIALGRFKEYTFAGGAKHIMAINEFYSEDDDDGMVTYIVDTDANKTFERFCGNTARVKYWCYPPKGV